MAEPHFARSDECNAWLSETFSDEEPFFEGETDRYSEGDAPPPSFGEAELPRLWDAVREQIPGRVEEKRPQVGDRSSILKSLARLAASLQIKEGGTGART